LDIDPLFSAKIFTALYDRYGLSLAMIGYYGQMAYVIYLGNRVQGSRLGNG